MVGIFLNCYYYFSCEGLLLLYLEQPQILQPKAHALFAGVGNNLKKYY
jgi:hypothetical protein